MQSPFRTEAAAYRFLLLTVALFAVVVAAKQIAGNWGALLAFVAGVVALFVLYARERGERPPPPRPAPHPEDERRILVVANETVGGEALVDLVRERSRGAREQVLVVAPTLLSRVRHWASDEDAARTEARERLERTLELLAGLGVNARGDVAGCEPLQAIDDAVRTFGPDEIIISTHPEGRSLWLERNVVARARERVDVPVTHVVVDLEAEQEEIRS
jgi:hypothetical protein